MPTELLRTNERYLRGPAPVPTPTERARVRGIIADMRRQLQIRDPDRCLICGSPVPSTNRDAFEDATGNLASACSDHEIYLIRR